MLHVFFLNPVAYKYSRCLRAIRRSFFRSSGKRLRVFAVGNCPNVASKNTKKTVSTQAVTVI
ncbi:Uncharacterized protein APZ42_019703 [Daphnia magna]|uniref:Uncharacterized protein n=1 Tax=Daphnia magna TaxID=35525 RepID=A0A164Y4J1_9CRUS|nr:Uncharacterized protein APZ42_019703 [Daphnia magna]